MIVVVLVYQLWKLLHYTVITTKCFSSTVFVCCTNARCLLSSIVSIISLHGRVITYVLLYFFFQVRQIFFFFREKNVTNIKKENYFAESFCMFVRPRWKGKEDKTGKIWPKPDADAEERKMEGSENVRN
jgi:hypothetical protein